LEAMADSGILLLALNSVPNLVHFSAMTACESAITLPPDAMRRLAALCVLVIDDAERLSEKLRLTNAESAKLISMVQGYRELSPVIDGRELLYDRGAERFVDRVLLAWARSGAGAQDAGWRELATLPQRWTPPAFPLKAADLMQRGVAKGPKLGAALAKAERAWIAAGFPADADDIAKIADAAAAG
jgi:poly(A) polymerase